MNEIDDEILTGEGVALSTGAASVTLRMVSGLIDLIVLGTLTVIVVARAGSVFSFANDALYRAVLILVSFGLLVLLPATIETLTRGLSLGRWAMGLRVVREDGGPVAFRHAFTRALLGLVEIYLTLGMLAVTVSALSARAKRIGDMLAGTYAMRVRGAQRALPPVAMPPSLAEWAASADIRRLPDGLALTARMFLARATSLRPESRARLGSDLASRLSDYVAPQPPGYHHPESFIAAVLAERRNREWVIEGKRAARARRESARLDRLPYDMTDAAN